MKVGVYDQYWDTLGGGEQFAGGLAEVLSREHEVELVGPKPVDVSLFKERMGVDLSETKFRKTTTEQSVSEASSTYDLFVNCTYLSFVKNRAPKSLYVVHFPNPPASGLQSMGRAAQQTVASVIAKTPGIPPRLRTLAGNQQREQHPSKRLESYSRIVSNSTYTQHWVQKLWGVPSGVLYPPVRQPSQPVADHEKQPIILSLGRFLLSKHGHSKKQLELTEAFRILCDRGVAPGWRLVLIGGCATQDRDYAMAVKRAARGLPIDVIFNAPGEVVRSYLRSASIYWHGAGLCENPRRHPDRFEHFGISVVEAMAHGVVPVVFDAAGPAESVDSAGYVFSSISQLTLQTTALVADESMRLAASRRAVVRADEFGMRAFSDRLHGHIDSLVLSTDSSRIA